MLTTTWRRGARSASFGGLLGLCLLFPGSVRANWSCDDPLTSLSVNDLPTDYFVSGDWARAVVPDQSGGIYVTWEEDASTTVARCRIQHLDSNGNRLWGAEGLALIDMDDQHTPGLVVDPAGGVFAYVASSPTPEPNFEVRMQHFGPGGERQWGTFGRVVYQACGISAYRPYIVTDGANGFFLSVVTTPTPNQVRIQHISSSGQLLWGGGSPCGIVAVTTLESVFNAGVLADGAGGLFLSYDEFAGNETGGLNVRAERLDANGNPTWGTGDGIMVCSRPLDQFAVAPLPDGMGGVLLFWYSRHSPDFFDYVGGQRLDGNGNPLWATNGEQVLPLSNYLSAVLSDGQGGAWISTWRWGNERDDYLQRVNRDAETMLPDFVPICAAPQRQYGAALVDDHAGGCYAVWTDWRNGGSVNQDLYFQHFGAAGQIYEMVDGTPITTEPDTQGQGWAVTSDQSGASWVIWDTDSPFAGVSAERLPCASPTGVEEQTQGLNASISVIPNPLIPRLGPAEIRLARAPNISSGGAVDIFDAGGRRCRRLFSVNRGAGGTFLWDGTDDAGVPVPSGVYLIRTPTPVGRDAGAVIVTR